MERHPKEEDHVRGGYVLLARALEESAVWTQDHHILRLWIYLLLKARWKEQPEQRGSVIIQRGQVLKAYRAIMEENAWVENRRVRKWSLSRVGRMIEWLKQHEMISTSETELGTLITVQNFNKYQHPGAYGSEVGTELGTHLGTPTTGGNPSYHRRSDGPLPELGTEPGTHRGQQEEGEEERTTSLVREVFDYWQERRTEAMGKTSGPPMKATDKRLSKIRARLREGYSVEDLQQAIDGCLLSDYHIEHGYTDIELVCRDQVKVEQFLHKARTHRKPERAPLLSEALDRMGL